MKVPFFDYASIYKSRAAEFKKVIDAVGGRGAFILQDDLKDFEENIANYCNCHFAVGVGNATDALEMLLKVGGVGYGDEVIFCTHTMMATASAIHYNGAVPVPVEAGADHLIDPDSIKEAITSRTKAIIPTQLNGRTANMDNVCEIANKYGLLIFEDSAQALGSRFKNQFAGTFGVGGCISFYPAKILGCFGDGGMILCNDERIYQDLILLRDHGRDPLTGEVLIWGRNSRLDNLQAAILNYQFGYFDNTINRRREIASIYNESLNKIEQISLPPPPDENSDHFDVFQNYEIEANNRDKLKSFLHENGIGTLVQWGGKAVHQFSKLGFNQSLPFTERLFERILMLPMNMSLTDDDVNYVCDKIIEFYRS